MPGKVRTWVWVLVGIAVLGILAVVAVAGAGFYFVSQHIVTKTATREAAAQEFNTAKASLAQGREHDDRPEWEPNGP